MLELLELLLPNKKMLHLLELLLPNKKMLLVSSCRRRVQETSDVHASMSLVTNVSVCAPSS